ncbi:hypothetical protein [Lichenicoccus sp.]|uniref:hypothetical protein n=1 Tax=Lichenicoccus sp. TaxID=2781899 RepID=UPI003D0F4969
MSTDSGSIEAEQQRERRLHLLIGRLPPRLQSMIHWLRRPSSGWLRVPAGLFFIVGGLLAILPVFGLWMLPLGVVLLSEDIPALRHWTGRRLAWIERKHPRWLGRPRDVVR